MTDVSVSQQVPLGSFLSITVVSRVFGRRYLLQTFHIQEVLLCDTTVGAKWVLKDFGEVERRAALWGRKMERIDALEQAYLRSTYSSHKLFSQKKRSFYPFYGLSTIWAGSAFFGGLHEPQLICEADRTRPGDIIPRHL